MWPWWMPLNIPRNQMRFLRLPLHQTSLNPTWRRPQFPPRTRQCQDWLPTPIRTTSRMEKKSFVKFAYVAHHETCQFYRQRYVRRWIFSVLSHRQLSRQVATRRLKILSNPSMCTNCSVNQATRRNFTLPMTAIPLQVTVPQITK
jgi:hypothetical protein